VLGKTIRSLSCVAAVGALALGALGCGGDDDDAEPVTDIEAGDSDTPTPAADDGSVVVVDAYLAHWDALLAAGDPPNPQSPGLAETMTGAAFSSAQSFLSANAAEGLALRGSYTHDAEAISVTGTAATVEDCGEDGTSLVVAATGSVVEAPDETPEGVVADLVNENGAWKVSTLRYDDQVCA
jgi:hypothetical protein